MNTLGNDIVNVSIKRYKFENLNIKFIERVFTLNEQLMIKTSLYPTFITWLLWAAKEAAFKACQKNQLDLVFAHRKFEVIFNLKEFHLLFKLNDKQNYKFIGHISYERQRLKCLWTIYSKPQSLIHCIAILNPYNLHYEYSLNNLNNDINVITDQIQYTIFPINSKDYFTESLDTRKQAKQYLINNGFDKKIEILRSKVTINGKYYKTPPKLFINNLPLNNIEISISHDHGFGAFVYCHQSAI